jgi:CO/xanthine dehydrogenase Mo-binding subunit
MRGHGATHTRFAAEIQMDIMAEELGIDPVEVRLKNAITAPHETINRVTVDSCGLVDGIKTLSEHQLWKGKGDMLKKKKENRSEEDHMSRGVGLSSSAYLGGARQRGHQSCAAVVRLCEDGTIDYLTGATDCGQGSDTVLVQIIAEELGIGIEEIDIKRVDTAYTPCDAGSYGSRVTVLAGDAARKAALDVRRQLADVASTIWKVRPEDIIFKAGQVYAKESPEKSMSFRRLTQIASYKGSGAVIIGKGYSGCGIEELDFDKGIGNSGTSYSFTSQLTEVDIDTETGFIKCGKIVLAHDCGRPLNPVNVEAQSQGAVIQGMGQAIYEKFVMDSGNTLNSNLADYRMPLSTDVPDIEFIDIIAEDPNGPYGAKEASEGAIVSAPPSIVNAIHDATGIWFKELPVTPEKIVMALKERNKK